MNKLQIIAEVSLDLEGIDETTHITIGSSDYQPGNVDSMLSAITKVTEQVKQLRERADCSRFIRVEVCIKRENDQVIDIFDARDFETVNQIINKMCIV